MDLAINKMEVLFNNKVIGYLEMLENNSIAFQYAPNWLKNGFNISPFSLPLTNDVYISKSPYFKGLYGVFSDSLPDGWGEFLIRRILMKKGINFDKISPLTRLSLIDQSGLGGLDYRPTQGSKKKHNIRDLDLVNKQIRDEINDRNDGLNLDELFKLGGASGGARPKVHLYIDGDEWIVKFPALNDNNNIGLEEYHANCLARKSGINVAEFKLFDSELSQGFFGTKRFDRMDNRKCHVISLSSILETTHHISNLDYIHLFQVIENISVDKEDLYEAFRRMSFNVLYGNKDDHGKNHSFIYDESKQGYVLSKAYDITKTKDKFQHELTVNGEGNPDENNLIEVQEIMKLSKHRCLDIIENIKNVIKEN